MSLVPSHHHHSELKTGQLNGQTNSKTTGKLKLLMIAALTVDDSSLMMVKLHQQDVHSSSWLTIDWFESSQKSFHWSSWQKFCKKITRIMPWINFMQEANLKFRVDQRFEETTDLLSNWNTKSANGSNNHWRCLLTNDMEIVIFPWALIHANWGNRWHIHWERNSNWHFFGLCTVCNVFELNKHRTNQINDFVWNNYRTTLTLIVEHKSIQRVFEAD
jgi:hypothetical protein